MKKVLSLVIVTVIALSCLGAVSASADGEITVGTDGVSVTVDGITINKALAAVILADATLDYTFHNDVYYHWSFPVVEAARDILGVAWIGQR